MKVLHINSYYSYYGSPGFYKNMYDRQVLKGIDISVFVPLDYEVGSEEQFGSYTQVVKTHSSIHTYFYHLKQNRMLREAQRRYAVTEFDIMHAHSTFSNGFVAYKLNQQFGVPYIVAVRDTDLNIFFKKMLHLRRLGNEILAKADKVVFLSQPYKEVTINRYIHSRYRENITAKSEVIPNGINSFWLENKAEPKKTHNSVIRLLFVGSISRRKNPLATVEAIRILRKRGYKVEFMLVGPVRDQSVLTEILKNDFVSYMGPQDKDKLLHFYRSCDIFIMPSIRETFGLVYAEAMSQGLPIIYTRGQGFDRQFEEGVVGYSVNPTDYDEIADRIVDIIRNYEELSSNCIRLCSRFDWDIITDAYFNMYKALLFKKHCK